MVVNSTECQAPSGDFGFSRDFVQSLEPIQAHRAAEVESTKTMSDRVGELFDTKPDRLIGDTAYGTAPMLA